MLEVTLSEQYQISIPPEIRDSLHLQAGQKFSISINDNLISLMPKPDIQSFRGILKGANTDNIRDRWKIVEPVVPPVVNYSDSN